MSEPASSLRERKKLQTWNAIRSAALDLFSRRGFEHVSVEEIAAAADVSRTTFFNYFAGKEAVVFDPHPEDGARWRSLIAAHSSTEPVWEAVTAVFLGFAELVGDRLALQKQLKASSPALSQSARDSSDRFLADVRDWLAERDGDSGDAANEGTHPLLFHVAVAATTAAYEIWDPDQPFEEYLHTLRRCLDQAGRGVAGPPEGAQMPPEGAQIP